MVTKNNPRAPLIAQGFNAPEATERVWATVHEIAGKKELVFRARLEQVEESLKRLKTTLEITDKEAPHICSMLGKSLVREETLC